LLDNLQYSVERSIATTLRSGRKRNSRAPAIPAYRLRGTWHDRRAACWPAT